MLLPEGDVASGFDVVVLGTRIEAVTPRGNALPTGAPVLDVPGASLLPGMIDSHVHLTFSADAQLVENVVRETAPAQLARAAGNAQRALASGITTAVDCGGLTEVVVALRDGIASGRLQGPRLLVSGAPLTTTAGHCHWLGGTADSQDDLIRAMRSLVAAGVDVIKVMVTGGNITEGSNPSRLQFPPDSIAALARECERLGRSLITHAHTTEAVELSAAVGARVIAHSTCAMGEGAVELDEATIKRLLAAGCYVDPTLMVARPGYGDGSDRSERRLAQRRAMLPLFAEMHRSGIPLLAGTDAGVPGVPHGSVAGSVIALHREIGLPVAQALCAATSVPARAFQIDDQVGALLPGRSADLLLLDGLVGDDIEATGRPLAVWKAGALVARGGLLTFT
ncbi:MAG TPA: amidohydrolase family protein [Rhodoglobus sp.]|nr:amidohydrolase family protein [Rhodoglobus sp.]